MNIKSYRNHFMLKFPCYMFDFIVEVFIMNWLMDIQFFISSSSGEFRRRLPPKRSKTRLYSSSFIIIFVTQFSYLSIFYCCILCTNHFWKKIQIICVHSLDSNVFNQIYCTHFLRKTIGLLMFFDLFQIPQIKSDVFSVWLNDSVFLEYSL